MTKLQASTSKLQRSSKLQISSVSSGGCRDLAKRLECAELAPAFASSTDDSASFGFWCLELLWSLELGFWSFALTPPTQLPATSRSVWSARSLLPLLHLHPT